MLWLFNIFDLFISPLDPDPENLWIRIQKTSESGSKTLAERILRGSFVRISREELWSEWGKLCNALPDHLSWLDYFPRGGGGHDKLTECVCVGERKTDLIPRWTITGMLCAVHLVFVMLKKVSKKLSLGFY